VHDDGWPHPLDEGCRHAGCQQVVAPVVDHLGAHPVDAPVAQDVLPDQPARAGDQGDGGHDGASLSRFEMTETGSGHSMFTVGSLQRRLRAPSGTYGALITYVSEVSSSSVW
jgi:hypothetical protein